MPNYNVEVGLKSDFFDIPEIKILEERVDVKPFVIRKTNANSVQECHKNAFMSIKNNEEILFIKDEFGNIVFSYGKGFRK